MQQNNYSPKRQKRTTSNKTNTKQKLIEQARKRYENKTDQLQKNLEQKSIFDRLKEKNIQVEVD